MNQTDSTLEPQDQQVLNALKEAVTETLERKRLLGQYAVVWHDNKPEFIGKTPDDSAFNSHRNR